MHMMNIAYKHEIEKTVLKNLHYLFVSTLLLVLSKLQTYNDVLYIYVVAT